MKTISISDEDYEFLKDLKHELNTQDNDGTADPVYWGVMEEEEVWAPEGCGYPKVTHDDGSWTLEEAVEVVNEIIHEYEPDIQDEWKEVDKDYVNEVADFMRERLKLDYCDVVWAETKEVINYIQGGSAFLTKRACKDYIKRYSYNHNKPHTYAICAYRNPELAKLLKILGNLNFSDND